MISLVVWFGFIEWITKQRQIVVNRYDPDKQIAVMHQQQASVQRQMVENSTYALQLHAERPKQ